MQNVYKNKGKPTHCDDHRGILLADTCSKGLTSIIKESIDLACAAHIPRSQYGAVAKRGADYASMVVRLFISFATASKKSIFVLFLDLVKAFDKAIREIVFGFGPMPPEDPAAAFEALGVSRPAAAWIASYLQTHGPVLLGWGVNEKAVEMAQALHAGAWFAVGADGDPVASATGGRQGCKLGATTFNSHYSVALSLLHHVCEEKGISLRLRVPDAAFWADPDPANESAVPTLDATFVDDEAIVLVADTPKQLDVLIEIFDNLHLELKWKPGKSECLLKCRGPGAAAHLHRRRQSDGQLAIRVPRRDDVWLSVVQEYKHLGYFVCVMGNGDTFANTRHRVSSALAAYAPLACKTFGSDLLSVQHRLAFLRSALFAGHTLVPTGRDLKAMSGCYMRGLRRIASVPRFSPENSTTDRQIRDTLQQPSLDCLLARARLAFAARVCRDRPAELLALLHLRAGCDSSRLPWVTQLASDVDVLLNFLAISQWPSLFAGPAVLARQNVAAL
ncbi:unnamed protein product [Prorocentrum cordatum]|uniref:Reverse transcriptase domain-containing protein n=1 Tax=Prorocentrum cordatum TaxID=2364126 RepID=A0ABN9WXQ3_9DINO|nr:unnamed protein product [Polarella glacialis]